MQCTSFLTYRRFIFLSLCLIFSKNITAQTDSALLASAKKCGIDMSNWFLNKTTTITTDYPVACSYYGICILSEAVKDTSLLNTVSKRYKTFLSGGGSAKTGSVDNNVHGIVPLELYRQTKYAPFLTAGLRLASDEFSPTNPNHLRTDSLSTYSRFWVDDMYMIGSLQTQAFKSTDSAKYINNAARTLSRYIDSLQQSNGLFYHCPPLKAFFYWGRGNGWAAASMAELLCVLPASHPLRARIMTSYTSQMQALAQCQDTSGMWHQLLDRKTTFIESSCSAMFVFALATGIHQGWLNEDSFKSAAKKGWATLSTYFDATNGLRSVCTGLAAGASDTTYTLHPQKTGDPHGTASFIWAATAMVRWLGDTPTIAVKPAKAFIPNARNKGMDNRVFDMQGRILHSAASENVPAQGIHVINNRRALIVK
jgi:rhamnogalacturonyl hydrolase YesR